MALWSYLVQTKDEPINSQLLRMGQLYQIKKTLSKRLEPFWKVFKDKEVHQSIPYRHKLGEQT